MRLVRFKTPGYAPMPSLEEIYELLIDVKLNVINNTIKLDKLIP